MPESKNHLFFRKGRTCSVGEEVYINFTISNNLAVFFKTN